MVPFKETFRINSYPHFKADMLFVIPSDRLLLAKLSRELRFSTKRNFSMSSSGIDKIYRFFSLVTKENSGKFRTLIFSEMTRLLIYFTYHP